MAINGCAECLKKQRAIDRLTEELQRLKQKAPLPGTAGYRGLFRRGDPLCQAARQGQHPSTPGRQAERRTAGAPRGWAPSL